MHHQHSPSTKERVWEERKLGHTMKNSDVPEPEGLHPEPNLADLDPRPPSPPDHSKDPPKVWDPKTKKPKFWNTDTKPKEQLAQELEHEEFTISDAPDDRAEPAKPAKRLALPAPAKHKKRRADEVSGTGTTTRSRRSTIPTGQWSRCLVRSTLRWEATRCTATVPEPFYSASRTATQPISTRARLVLLATRHALATTGLYGLLGCQLPSHVLVDRAFGFTPWTPNLEPATATSSPWPPCRQRFRLAVWLAGFQSTSRATPDFTGTITSGVQRAVPPDDWRQHRLEWYKFGLQSISEASAFDAVTYSSTSEFGPNTNSGCRDAFDEANVNAATGTLGMATPWQFTIEFKWAGGRQLRHAVLHLVAGHAGRRPTPSSSSSACRFTPLWLLHAR